jgi:thiamine pyrophosphate-dependent acetolactate synthase large subunit-like protein
VLNNGVMTHYHEHMPYATQHHQANQLGGNYTAIAEGLGVHAQRVATPDGLAPAIKRAIAANQSGQPALIEILTKEEETVSRFAR